MTLIRVDLPGAVVADQPDDFVSPNLKGNVTQGMDRAEVLLDVLHTHDVGKTRRRVRVIISFDHNAPRWRAPLRTAFKPPLSQAFAYSCRYRSLTIFLTYRGTMMSRNGGSDNLAAKCYFDQMQIQTEP